jgi:hypothetical protein
MADEPLFPDEEPRPGRYQARTAARPWTPAEDVVVILVLTACGSSGAALRAAHWLCGLMGRRPAYAPGDRPTAQRRVTDSHDLIEARRWKMVAGYKDYVPPDLGMIRDEVSLTWGECVLFLRPWIELGEKNKPRTSIMELCFMLGRANDVPVQRYALAVRNHPKLIDPINERVEPAKIPGLEPVVLRYLKESMINGGYITPSLGTICDILEIP